MITLNLEATTQEHILIKDYLQQSAGEVLAEKINNGVRFEKDGTELINKKDIASFMKYACNKARKEAEKGAVAACVKDDTVYSWAVHYFEEDSIEGKLYNLDGTEYKPKSAIKTKTTTPAPPPAPKPKPQISMFDMMDSEPMAAETAVTTDTEPSVWDKPIYEESASPEYIVPVVNAAPAASVFSPAVPESIPVVQSEPFTDNKPLVTTDDESDDNSGEHPNMQNLTHIKDDQYSDRDGIIYTITNTDGSNITNEQADLPKEAVKTEVTSASAGAPTTAGDNIIPQELKEIFGDMPVRGVL